MQALGYYDAIYDPETGEFISGVLWEDGVCRPYGTHPEDDKAALDRCKKSLLSFTKLFAEIGQIVGTDVSAFPKEIVEAVRQLKKVQQPKVLLVTTRNNVTWNKMDRSRNFVVAILDEDTDYYHTARKGIPGVVTVPKHRVGWDQDWMMIDPASVY